MLKVVLVLLLTAICCIGQRRWAGSYSRIHPAEDTVTWDDRNYKRPETETSTEYSIRYRGKWPADNSKGQDMSDVNSAPYNPPIRRDEYDSRMDERPRSSISQTAKVDVDDKRPHGHPLSEDEYHKREIDRPVIANERDYYPRDKRKGEDPRANHNITRTVNTSLQIGSNTGNTGKPYEGLPQDRNQKRIPSVSTEAYDNRHRDDLGYKGYEEVPVMQRTKGDRTQFPGREYVRPGDQSNTRRQDDKAEAHVSRDNRNRHKQSSRDDGMVGYARAIGESKYETPQIERSHGTRQHAGNGKGNMEKAYKGLPQDRNQQRHQPVTTERYDDINYKEYKGVSETPRPKVERPQATAREYVRPSNQTDHPGKGYRNIYKHGSRDEMGDRTIVESEEKQGERHIPAQSKGDIGYGYDRQHEERLAAREYDKGREEELKQREYERRLEEEIRRKGEERSNTGIKGIEYSREHELEVRERNHKGREGIVSGSEYNRRKDQQIKGMMSKREENVKGIEPNRQQQDRSDREYPSREIVHARREEVKGRNFRAKSEENPKGGNDELRRGMGHQERNLQWKGKGQTSYDLKQEDEYRTMKGDDDIRRRDRETNRREIVEDTRKQIKAQHSEERQGGKIERPEYSVNAKGDVYDREMDYNLRSPISRDHKDSIQRTTRRPVDNDDLRMVETTIKRYHTRLDNNRNRVTEQSLIQNATESSIRPVLNSQRKDENLRNHEISQENMSLSQQRNIDSNQRTTNRRNSEESIGFRSTVAPSYEDVNDHYARRMGTTRDESMEGYPSNKERRLYNERTVPRTDEFVNPVYSDSIIRQSSQVDQTREISKYPSIVNSGNNAGQPTNSNSRKQSSVDNWRSSTSPLDVGGYHPNVSYDAIVFLNDENDDEGDVWNLSDQKANEPSHVPNEDQENYRREHRTPLRGNQEKATQQHRNEEDRTLISGAIEPKPRNRRAAEEFLIQETRIRLDSAQRDETDDIHPDVEILPGYGITRQFGQRNYNDEVIDDEVELFSEKEIRVNARDYKGNGNIASVRSQHNGNRTSLQGRRYEDLQVKPVGNKETQFSAVSGKEEIVRHSQTDMRKVEAEVTDSIPENSPGSTKTDSSERRYFH